MDKLTSVIGSIVIVAIASVVVSALFWVVVKILTAL